MLACFFVTLGPSHHEIASHCRHIFFLSFASHIIIISYPERRFNVIRNANRTEVNVQVENITVLSGN